MINWQSFPIRSVLASLIVITLYGCASAPEQSSPAINPAQAVAPNLEQLTTKQASQLAQAKTQLNNGQYEEAKKILLKIHKSASNVSVLSNLALAYYKSGDLESAAKFVGKAIQIAPGQAQIHNLAGTINLDLRQFQKAEYAFKEALRLDGDYALAHYNLAILYDIYYQDVDSAYTHYLKYLALINYEDKQTLEWVDQLKYSITQE
ncbi:tetratricopeptide repeat protein [Teredinibacter turnerae]|uniref:tetratricopeptide repeat protein n=1 Tax=Teredinibacter turnerae TaxID=2426 RepID=UPI00035DEF2A|nr:tetratricopeptide repeat protein [Teredinibacter turnerae]